MKKTFLSALSILAIGCGGGVPDGSDVSGQNSSEKIARASQTLRLGQTPDPNSSIAISAAIDNFESFIALGRDRLEYVLYTTSEGNIIRITLDPSGRPLSAQSKDTAVTFSNFTATTVDVTIGGSTVTVPVNSSGAVTTGDDSSLFKNISSVSLQEILDTIANAIKTFGCASAEASDQVAVSSSFSSAAKRTCRSLIIDAVRVKIDKNEVEQLPVKQDLEEPAGCDINQPGWEQNFLLSQGCAARVADQIIREIFVENPTLITEVNENTTPSDIFEEELDESFDDVFEDDIAETPVTEPAPPKEEDPNAPPPELPKPVIPGDVTPGAPKRTIG